MGRNSFLHDLHALGRFDRERFEGFRFRDPEPRVEALVASFENLAEQFPPGEAEAAGAVPPEAIARMGELGLFGMSIPGECGGAGLPFSQYLKVVERMAAVDLSLALVSLAHLSIGVQGIVLFGSDDQKRKYLPPAAAGERVFAYALTEPATGSDAKHIRTSARRSDDGTHWVLSGQKTYITNANYAQNFTVFAQIEGNRPGHMGAFIVDRASEGLTVGPDMPKMGLKASSTAFLRFDDVRVPDDDLLGAPGDGFRIAMTVLSYGRLAVCAAGLGLMERSVGDMIRRATGRVQFGVPISSFELVQEKIASAQVSRFVGANMVEFAARQLEDDPAGNVAVETSHCKLFCTTRAWQVLYDAMQVAGGSGYLATSPYERRMRDYRVATIFEGTTEIHSIYPALLLLRGIGENLPRAAASRVAALLRGAVRGSSWPIAPDLPGLREAARLARCCGRWVRRLLHLGALVWGKGVTSREYLLRRITWLSARQYGILSALGRIEGDRREGRDVGESMALLAAFVQETDEALPSLRRLWPSRLERALGRVSARAVDGFLKSKTPAADA